MKMEATVWEKFLQDICLQEKMFAGLDLEYIKNLAEQQYEEQPNWKNMQKTWAITSQKEMHK